MKFEESFLAPGHRHDAGTLAGELQNKFAPDAAGSSGHKNAKAGKGAAGHEEMGMRGLRDDFPHHRSKIDVEPFAAGDFKAAGVEAELVEEGGV